MIGSLTKLCRACAGLALLLPAVCVAQTSAASDPAEARTEPSRVVLTDYRDIGEAQLCKVEGLAHFTGTVELRHQDGRLMRRLACTDGEKNGLDRQFYKSGALLMERSWKAGTLDGLYRHWTEDGTLQEQWTYGPKGLEGAYYVFHPNGTQAAFAHYTHGKRNGRYADFDEDGKFKASGTYVDGEPDGEAVERTMYGGYAYRHFDRGKRVGLQTLWSEDGTILRLTRYTDDGRFVRERMWNTHGDLIREISPVTIPDYGSGLKIVEHERCTIHTVIQSGVSDPAKLATLGYTSSPNLYRLETITRNGKLIERVEAFDHKLLAEPVHKGKPWECPVS